MIKRERERDTLFFDFVIKVKTQKLMLIQI
jgi:hypothetical protein